MAGGAGFGRAHIEEVPMAQQTGPKGQQNQTEGEYFAVVETGRKGVEQALDTMHDELMAVAAAPVRKQGESWKARALATVTANDGLRDVLAHKRGIWSIYQSLARAAQMGLQIGGNFPHAYLVPFAPQKGAKKQAQLIITAEGYLFAAKHGPQPVIKDATYAAVRDGDEISIDQAKGSVSHRVNPLADRGEVLGVWVQVQPIGAQPVVKWYTKAELIKVRDERSLSWKFDKSRSPWSTDEEAMLVKTAVKRALKPYAAEAEGLSMLYADDETPGEAEPPRAERDVTDRASGAIDAMMGSVADDADVEQAAEEAAAEQATDTEGAPEANPEGTPEGNPEATPEENDLF
jgi:phage RecT family recombinase